METNNISDPDDGPEPSYTQSTEILPTPPEIPPQMEPQLGPSLGVENAAPPPPLPPQMALKLPEVSHYVLTKRPGQGQADKPVKLLCNHFRVSFTNVQDSFQYDVKITAERGGQEQECASKILCTTIMDKVKEIYSHTELGGKDFDVDEEKDLFRVGPLRNNIIQCNVLVGDKRNKQSHEHYQKSNEVVVTVFAKGQSKESVVVEFNEQFLSIIIDIPAEDNYVLHKHLFAKEKNIANSATALIMPLQNAILNMASIFGCSNTKQGFTTCPQGDWQLFGQ